MAWLPAPPRKPPGWVSALVFIAAEFAILWLGLLMARSGWL